MAIGWLIALAGPPIGYFFILVGFNITIMISEIFRGNFEFLFFYKAVQFIFLFLIFTPLSYVFGGLQSIFVAFYVALKVKKYGYVSKKEWFSLTFILGAVSSIVFAFLADQDSKNFLFRLVQGFFFFFLPSLVTALILRWIIVRKRWMIEPSA